MGGHQGTARNATGQVVVDLAGFPEWCWGLERHAHAVLVPPHVVASPPPSLRQTAMIKPLFPVPSPRLSCMICYLVFAGCASNASGRKPVATAPFTGAELGEASGQRQASSMHVSRGGECWSSLPNRPPLAPGRARVLANGFPPLSGGHLGPTVWRDVDVQAMYLDALRRWRPANVREERST